MPRDFAALEGRGVALEMPAGSVAIFPGALHHRAGANRSRHTRLGPTIQYRQPWLRQLENLKLGTPRPQLSERQSGARRPRRPRGAALESGIRER